MPKPNIELRIDELVLVGVPYGRRFSVAAALEWELGRLLGTASPVGRELKLELLEVDVGDGGSAEAIGRAAARAAFQRLYPLNSNDSLTLGTNG